MNSIGLGVILQQNIPLINYWFFLLFINDLPKITTKNAKFVLYAGDSSIIISNLSTEDFKINIIKVFYRYKWVIQELLVIRIKKKNHYLQFRINNSQEINVNISYDNKQLLTFQALSFLF